MLVCVCSCYSCIKNNVFSFNLMQTALPPAAGISVETREAQLPEPWGHCRHSCSELSATSQQRTVTPAPVLQSPGRIWNIPTNLLLHVLIDADRPPEPWAVRFCTGCVTGSCHSSLLFGGKMWTSRVFWLRPLACMRWLILQEPHRNVAPIYVHRSEEEGGRRGGGRGGLPEVVFVVVVFSLHIHHLVKWIQLLLWRPRGY